MNLETRARSIHPAVYNEIADKFAPTLMSALGQEWTSTA
jgi:hypothetical protein